MSGTCKFCHRIVVRPCQSEAETTDCPSMKRAKRFVMYRRTRVECEFIAKAVMHLFNVPAYVSYSRKGASVVFHMPR